MVSRNCKGLIILFAVLFFAATTFADPRIGQLLEEALDAQETGTVAEVSEKFEAAADSTTNIGLKSNIMLLFSDYLLAQREWVKMIEVQNEILADGDKMSQAGAYYNLIRADLELNRFEDAREAARKLNACPSGEYMREHAHNMKKVFPGGIHATISDLLLANPASEPSVAETASMTTACCYEREGELQTPADQTSEEALKIKQDKDLEQNQTGDSKERTSYVVSAGAWNSALDGELESMEMSLDFENDLSSDRETSLVLAVESWLTPQDRLKATYVNFAFNGNLTRTVVHNAQTYNSGSSFHLRNMFLDIEGFHALQRRSPVTWGFLYGLMLTDSELEVIRNTPAIRDVSTWGSQFGYPYLGVAARSNYSGNFGWDASLKLFAWNGDGRYNTHDLELKLLLGQGSRKGSSSSTWWGYIGYRDFRWEGDFERDSGAIHFSGPILGLEILF